MAAELPRRIDINPWGFWGHSVAGGSITRTQSSVNLSGGQVNQGTPAIDNEIGWNVLLGAGTWTLTLIHSTNTNRGIYTVKLDSTTIGTIDGYAATPALNVVNEITSISVATSAMYTLKFVMASKNASSSNYYYSLLWITFRRTA